LKILGKYIVLYSRHRQIEPVISDPYNRNNYWFINFNYLWKPLRILGSTNHSKFRVFIYIKLLKLINPSLILDINWIGRLQTVHDLFARKVSKTCKFIVIQHGNYSAGKIESSIHRTVRCSVFWIWGKHYLEQLELNGRRFYVGGNPVYNKFYPLNNDTQKYAQDESKKILFLNSYINDLTIKKMEKAALNFQNMGFEVHWKPHNLYKGIIEISNVKVLSNLNIYEAFYRRTYRYVITDESTSLLDAVFFKNDVLFMKSGKFNSVNLYNSFLNEFKVEALTDNIDLSHLVNKSQQEKMFNEAISLFDHNKLVLESL